MKKILMTGLVNLGFETLVCGHPIIPILIRNTVRTRILVDYLFGHQILATGLNYPIVPK